ncbi:MAG TPA: gluconate 2-dehydrogenase subunit 3 family protein [Thermodesulfobacteriota bacterium]|nr:gluconate 2-dehydrogenase subunit 3 family protein [Thermodesulfobacteriota bacterium]
MTTQQRYPGYRVLDQRGHWDSATRRVVLDRVHNVPPFRHFGPDQRAVLEALCERVIPQSDKPPDRRVPIAPWIDQMAMSNVEEGFRFDDMPPNHLAWERGLEGLNQTAEEMFGRSFCLLGGAEQDRVLEEIRGGNPPGDVWKTMPASRWWKHIAVRQISGIYYSHPFAWDEIGFGGPAYPRGYLALNFGQPEPWESPEGG